MWRSNMYNHKIFKMSQGTPTLSTEPVNPVEQPSGKAPSPGMWESFQSGRKSPLLMFDQQKIIDATKLNAGAFCKKYKINRGICNSTVQKLRKKIERGGWLDRMFSTMKGAYPIHVPTHLLRNVMR